MPKIYAIQEFHSAESWNLCILLIPDVKTSSPDDDDAYVRGLVFLRHQMNAKSYPTKTQKKNIFRQFHRGCRRLSVHVYDFFSSITFTSVPSPILPSPPPSPIHHPLTTIPSPPAPQTRQRRVLGLLSEKNFACGGFSSCGGVDPTKNV